MSSSSPVCWCPSRPAAPSPRSTGTPPSLARHAHLSLLHDKFDVANSESIRCVPAKLPEEYKSMGMANKSREINFAWPISWLLLLWARLNFIIACLFLPIPLSLNLLFLFVIFLWLELCLPQLQVESSMSSLTWILRTHLYTRTDSRNLRKKIFCKSFE